MQSREGVPVGFLATASLGVECNRSHLSVYGYAGVEDAWHDDCYLVPFDGSRMEWGSTSHGRPPMGKRPVEGGHEDDGTLCTMPSVRSKTYERPGKLESTLEERFLRSRVLSVSTNTTKYCGSTYCNTVNAR
jgi:hypothetical protein